MTESERIERLALRYDRAALNGAEMAMEPGNWGNSAFYIERAFQFSIVAAALHRMKDNPPPPDSEFRAEDEAKKAA